MPARLHQHAVARLGGEAGAASLLREVEEHAAPGAGDGGERGVELLGAVAVAGAVDLAGDARGVHAREQRRAAAEPCRMATASAGWPVVRLWKRWARNRPWVVSSAPHVEGEQRALHGGPLIGRLAGRASASS